MFFKYGIIWYCFFFFIFLVNNFLWCVENSIVKMFISRLLFYVGCLNSWIWLLWKFVIIIFFFGVSVRLCGLFSCLFLFFLVLNFVIKCFLLEKIWIWWLFLLVIMMFLLCFMVIFVGCINFLFWLFFWLKLNKKWLCELKIWKESKFLV